VARERETEAVRSHRQRSVEGGRRTVGAMRLPFAHRLSGLAINAIWHVKWADPIAALAVLFSLSSSWRVGEPCAGRPAAVAGFAASTQSAIISRLTEV